MRNGERERPPRRLPRLGLAAQAAACCALAALGLVLAAAPVQAQTSVWSATLTVSSASQRGCANSEAADTSFPPSACSNQLTEDEFSHGGTDYTVNVLATNASNQNLELSFSGVTSEADLNTIKTDLGALTLTAGTLTGKISDATVVQSYSNYWVLRWNTGVNTPWSGGDSVSVSLTAPAATATTFVSNTGQTAAASSITVGTIGTTNWSIAIAFETGSNTAGYTLAEVDVNLSSATPSANTRVSIYSTTSSGHPDSSLHVLTNPSSLTASATNTFTAPSGASLDANTTYAVVFEVTSGTATTELGRTSSDAEDAGAASGWSIGNVSSSKEDTAAWATVTSSSDVPQIAIKGTAKSGTTTPVVSISGGSAVTEGGSATFTVSASPAPAAALTVSLTISQSGSFVASGNLGSKTVTVPTSGSASYTVATVDDSTNEANGSVTATLATGTGYSLHATDTAASVTVNDNDTPVVSISGGSAVAEGGSATFTVSASPAPFAALTVSLTISQSGSFVASGNLGSKTVSVPTSGSADYTVATVNDSTNEANGSVTATLAAGTGYSLHATDTAASVTVNDNDTPVVSISGGTAVTEGGSASFTVSASPTPAAALTVSLTISQSGSFVASGNLGSKTVSVPTSGSATYTVATVDDSTDESNGSVTATLAAGTGYSVHATNSAASVTVNDDDGTPPADPEVSISGGTAVTEGGSASFTVSASPAPAAALTVSLTISQSGSFVASSNLGSKTVSVPTSGSATYTVATVNDSTDESNGSVTATLATGTGYTLHATNTAASVTVNDNDDPPANPQVSISGGPAVTEGGSATFTVSASPAPAAALTVSLIITQAGSFVASGNLGSKTVTVPTSGSATYTVATVNDSTDEANGVVRATLATGTGYSLHSTNNTASVTVNDNDDPSNPDQPGPEVSDDEMRRPDPRPLQLALWTDRPGYRAGETVRLYRSVDPHDDRGRYRTFVYLEAPGGGERRYLAPLSAHGQLRAEAVDSRGVAAGASAPRILYPADRELAWEGAAPAPGLWQFVMELRPAAEEEDPGDGLSGLRRTRRAWAKFVVAEGSQLLNRSGFDREIRSDMTLRSDTLYYLGHQLFVHDGATLTIEPGTVLQAWGSHAAIIVEPGGRIVAEGTREAPVVLTCSAFVGLRQPGCWAGLRILGRAPVTRLEEVAPGVLPPERPVYGGTDAEGSSGVLRYVRVEFAGASGDPEAPGPAIGLYGAGSGTVLDRVQVRASLGDGFAFHGGTAVCDHCVASGSGGAGLSWERGWRGGVSHLYVQHGRGGRDGLAGAHDAEGHDREPRSLPDLSNVTLVHSMPYGRHARRAVALRLSTGSGVQVRDLLAIHFGGGAVRATGRSRLLFDEGESTIDGALLWLNGSTQIPASIAEAAEFSERNPQLRDVRGFANPDPRPKAASPALTDERNGYIGAFSRTRNWLNEWTVFGPESVYDLRQRDDEGD